MIGYREYQALLEEIVGLFKKQFGDEFLACAVFGSVARGEAGKGSDIDIIVVHRSGNYYPTDRHVKVIRELREKDEYNRLCEQGFSPDPYPVYLSEEELTQNPWVLLDVTEDGIILYDKEDILKKRLDHLRQRLKQLGSKRIFLPDGSWYWDLKPDWKRGEEFKL